MKPILKTISLLTISLYFISSIFWTFILLKSNGKMEEMQFDGGRALDDVEYQLSLGPRTPGSPGHELELQWLKDTLDNNQWQTNYQKGLYNKQSITNVIAKRGMGRPWIILGAHYDTRLISDKDPNQEMRKLPVPGGNDGASGVAVLLEMSRVIPNDYPMEIWLVFFDAEDNGNIEGWDWIMGSRFFIDNLDGQPDAMVLVDMVGDKDLEIFMEVNSDPKLKTEIWRSAAELGYQNYFIPINKYAIIDDHIPFIENGIPAVNIIDFDYAYHHTVADTLDKVSAQSLGIVGKTILSWLDGLAK